MSTPASAPAPAPAPFLALVALTSTGDVDKNINANGFANGVLLVDANTNGNILTQTQLTSFDSWNSTNPKTEGVVAITFNIDSASKNVVFNPTPFENGFVIPTVTTDINKDLDSALNP